MDLPKYLYLTHTMLMPQHHVPLHRHHLTLQADALDRASLQGEPL